MGTQNKSNSNADEVLEICRIGLWQIENEKGEPPRFYADHLMNELLGTSDDMPPEERFRVHRSRVAPEDVKLFEEYADDLLVKPRAEIIYQYDHPSRGRMFVRCGGSRDLDYKGGIRINGYHQDITGIRRLEKEAWEKQTHILAALSSNYDMVYYVDLDADAYEIISADGFNLITDDRYRQKGIYSDMIAKYLAQNIHPDYYEEMYKLSTLSSLRGLMKVRDFSYRFRGMPGYGNGEFYEQHFVNPSYEDTEHIMVIGVRCIDEIIAEERKQRETLERTQSDLAHALREAQHSNNSKTVFLNNMSHDIRTPMNAIIGFTSLAMDHLNEPKVMEEYLQKIQISSGHLLTLINDVLDMSRIESGKVKLEESYNDIRTMLVELRSLVETDARAKGLELEVDVEGIRDNFIICDKMRVQRVLLNCLSNGIKFTKAGGKVGIKAWQKPLEEEGIGTYVFEIYDTGIGMHKSFIDHIFEEFSREETSTVSGIQGTGLGMSIAKNLVELMKGDIKVDSVCGEGTTFTITLQFAFDPNAQEKEKRQNELAKKPKAPLGAIDACILVVEDNELNREIAVEILKTFRLQIETAENGRQAVDMVAASEEGYYSLILMDVQMPVMNGYEATKEIRGLGRSDSKTVPIIAMTANAFNEDVRMAISVGMNAHMAKPLNRANFEEIINRYLVGAE